MKKITFLFFSILLLTSCANIHQTNPSQKSHFQNPYEPGTIDSFMYWVVNATAAYKAQHIDMSNTIVIYLSEYKSDPKDIAGQYAYDLYRQTKISGKVIRVVDIFGKEHRDMYLPPKEK